MGTTTSGTAATAGMTTSGMAMTAGTTASTTAVAGITASGTAAAAGMTALGMAATAGEDLRIDVGVTLTGGVGLLEPEARLATTRWRRLAIRSRTDALLTEGATLARDLCWR